MMMTLAQAHALLPGSELVGDGAIAIARVHTDTRTIAAGDLFVALRGERFDGHDFIAAARAAGAVAAIAERGLGDALPGLRVADTLAALQQLAAAWRARHALPLIAVTGSNGKTTVTQMIAAILRAWLGADALATAGNLNNHIGVPLTLLRLRPQHRAAVVELGMNHVGEIAELARIAAPTIALVNNAQREHQEFMAGVEAVARENGSVYAAMGRGGIAVMPAGDAHMPLWREMAGGRTMRTFGLDAEGAGPDAVADISADFSAHALWRADACMWSLTLRTPAGCTTTTLRQAGLHNVRNAVAAAACAMAAGAPLLAAAQGIADFAPVAGRSQTLTLKLGGIDATLIDDSYNANPDSVLAAIDVLAALPGPRWLVLGDMGEVGSQGPQFHAEVGARARAAGIEHFWSAGALSAHAGADRHHANVAELLQAMPQRPAAAAILVKGSRFMKMEQVVRALQQEASGAD
ncbi:MAG: UDP-N-acetylmuramoyl-tripeptide--D-alanyl-D-alanine ligase [Burkholderiales bacterium]|nr:UDP-N-acetylmuramoyl-tripeptide--D-alanyl-D-alanine ligase [Burkholderiales bacterium]